MGGNGNDSLGGGDDDDFEEGSAGNDNLSGADGADFLVGDDLFFTSTGSAGNDSLNGGVGTDTLVGGLGADTLTGGGLSTDVDDFQFDSLTEGGDIITDFTVNFDIIDVNASGFGDNLNPGADLPHNQFNYGITATEADDRFIYDNIAGSPTLGTLFYDVDGTGLGQQVAIASLVGAPTLTANDIFIFT